MVKESVDSRFYTQLRVRIPVHINGALKPFSAPKLLVSVRWRKIGRETLQASDIYSRLASLYIRRTKEALERKIEENMKEGLSREEAIKRIAEEEGIT